MSISLSFNKFKTKARKNPHFRNNYNHYHHRYSSHQQQLINTKLFLQLTIIQTLKRKRGKDSLLNRLQYCSLNASEYCIINMYLPVTALST